jgi:uncharacterized protein
MDLTEVPANDASYAVAQVTATPVAQALIDALRAEHGEILLYQSDGCCDAGAPVCFMKHEYPLTQGDRLLGHLGGVPFYMAQTQFAFFQRMQMCVDAIPGSGDSYSLEGSHGKAFVARSRLFTDDEWAWLLAHRRVTND